MDIKSQCIIGQISLSELRLGERTKCFLQLKRLVFYNWIRKIQIIFCLRVYSFISSQDEYKLSHIILQIITDALNTEEDLFTEFYFRIEVRNNQ
jgi:hypothetical protein